MRRAIQRLRVNARCDERPHEVEHRVVDDGGTTDARDVRLVIDDLARWAHLPLDHIVTDGGDALVKVLMTFFIFLAAPKNLFG